MHRRNPRSRSRVCFVTLFILSFLFLGRLRADSITLILTNGDRLTGEIQAETGFEVVFRSVLGLLKVPISQIARREPVSGSANKTVAPGATNAATGATGASPTVVASTNAAVVPTTSTNAPASSPRASELHLGNQSWLSPMLTNWHGSVQLGMDLGFGTSERRTFYANASANHTWNRVRNLIDYHVTYGILNQVESANKMDGSVKTDVDLGAKRRVYLYNQLGAGYDHIRQINRQFDAGAGVGYKFLERPKLKLAGEIGGQYQNFDYQSASGKSFFSARIGESLTWNVWEKLTVTQRLSYSPNVSDFTDYRIRFDLTAAYPLFKKVTLNLNVIDQYESRPAPTVHDNDLEVQSTLGVTF